MENVLDLEEEISEYERERGKPMPSFDHAEAQTNLVVQIAQYRDFKPLPELNVELGGMRFVPDIVVFEKSVAATLKGMMWVNVPPLLTIEILSPKQDVRSLFDKAKAYLQHGVAEAWIVVPEIKTITVCKQDGSQKTFVEGSITHASTGITVSLEQTFEE